MKRFFYFLLITQGVLANDLQNYLLPEYKELFATKLQKELATKRFDTLSWIAPITLSYSKTWSNQITARHHLQKSFSISINQPIFRFGGIYYGIKFAKSKYNLNVLAIKEQEKKLIIKLFSLLFQIRKNKLAIQKAKLQITNATIRVKKTKELFEAGLSNSLNLDDELIKLNEAKLALLHLQEQQNELLHAFKQLSNKSYKSIPLPKLRIVSKKEFLYNNFAIKKAQRAYINAINAQKVTIAKYLPTISLNANYNYTTPSDFARRKHFSSYGLTISLPLSMNSFNDIQRAKLAKLESALDIKTTQIAQNEVYEAKVKNIFFIKQKEALAKKEAMLYKRLYNQTKALFEAGQKSKDDVKLFYNSFKIKQLDSKIYYFEKELELLKLYEKMEQ